MVGHNCRIYTTSHDLDSGDFAQSKKPVRIDDYAVIFPSSLIMPREHIGRGAVVRPGSVVTKDVAAWTVVGGNPRHSAAPACAISTTGSATKTFSSIPDHAQAFDD